MEREKKINKTNSDKCNSRSVVLVSYAAGCDMTTDVVEMWDIIFIIIIITALKVLHLNCIGGKYFRENTNKNTRQSKAKQSKAVGLLYNLSHSFTLEQ